MRIRWYGLHTELDAGAIATLLRKRPYESGAPDGFVVEQLRSNYVEACLIQRQQITHEAVDPFGNQESYEIVEYLRTKFRITPETNSLEMHDPKRGNSRLIGRLAEALDQRFSIEEAYIDPLAWANGFRNLVGLFGVIERIQIGSIAVADGVVGQVLVKGSGEVADAAIKFVAPASYSLEKVQLRFSSARGAISFQRNSSVVLSSGYDDQWLDALRESLYQLQTPRRRAR
ncbi:hypothetical protein [Martelella soudanensis]|uniref:hypothetical protein n=1 Tax=unclassified Martelella TaxID=2629616 RepID=UPI0015DE7D49|nr:MULTISPECIES: hypothetical protein [unclassified Martelella]